mmetsp:Transcript_70717/g.202617  ORF Transcript_70717/g.202617 Transcript_70717/m.202617 type:complete len:266 (-) Transcript_70717:388-1185(-)
MTSSQVHAPSPEADHVRVREAGEQRNFQDEVADISICGVGVPHLLHCCRLAGPSALEYLAETSASCTVAAVEFDLPRLHVPRGPHHPATQVLLHRGRRRGVVVLAAAGAYEAGTCANEGRLLRGLQPPQVLAGLAGALGVQSAGVKHDVQDEGLAIYDQDVPAPALLVPVQRARRHLQQVRQELEEQRAVPVEAGARLPALGAAGRGEVVHEVAELHSACGGLRALEGQPLEARLEVRGVVPRAAEGLRHQQRGNHDPRHDIIAT